MPVDLQGDGGAAQRAYAAYARQDYAEAIGEARQAVQLAPEDATAGLLTTTLAAGNRSQQDEARLRLDAALAQRPDDAGLLMQRGYLNQKAHEPARALADFRAAEATGRAPKSVVLDQAYASAASGDHPQAVTLLRTAIDRADAGELPLDERQRYNVRSAIASYSREWGVIASAGFRGARQAATNVGGAAISTPGDSVFSTLEAFWRPRPSTTPMARWNSTRACSTRCTTRAAPMNRSARWTRAPANRRPMHVHAPNGSAARVPPPAGRPPSPRSACATPSARPA